MTPIASVEGDRRALAEDLASAFYTATMAGLPATTTDMASWDQVPFANRESMISAAMAVLLPIAEDRNFLLRRARLRHQGVIHGIRHSQAEIGLASEALVLCAFQDRNPVGHEFPVDADDLARCHQTVLSLPEHLRQRGQEVLDLFEAAGPR